MWRSSSPQDDDSDFATTSFSCADDSNEAQDEYVWKKKAAILRRSEVVDGLERHDRGESETRTRIIDELLSNPSHIQSVNDFVKNEMFGEEIPVKGVSGDEVDGFLNIDATFAREMADISEDTFAHMDGSDTSGGSLSPKAPLADMTIELLDPRLSDDSNGGKEDDIEGGEARMSVAVKQVESDRYAACSRERSGTTGVMEVGGVSLERDRRSVAGEEMVGMGVTDPGNRGTGSDQEPVNSGNNGLKPQAGEGGGGTSSNELALCKGCRRELEPGKIVQKIYTQTQEPTGNAEENVNDHVLFTETPYRCIDVFSEDTDVKEINLVSGLKESQSWTVSRGSKYTATSERYNQSCQDVIFQPAVGLMKRPVVTEPFTKTVENQGAVNYLRARGRGVVDAFASADTKCHIPYIDELSSSDSSLKSEDGGMERITNQGRVAKSDIITNEGSSAINEVGEEGEKRVIGGKCSLGLSSNISTFINVNKTPPSSSDVDAIAYVVGGSLCDAVGQDTGLTEREEFRTLTSGKCSPSEIGLFEENTRRASNQTPSDFTERVDVVEVTGVEVSSSEERNAGDEPARDVASCGSPSGGGGEKRSFVVVFVPRRQGALSTEGGGGAHREQLGSPEPTVTDIGGHRALPGTSSGQEQVERSGVCDNSQVRDTACEEGGQVGVPSDVTQIETNSTPGFVLSETSECVDINLLQLCSSTQTYTDILRGDLEESTDFESLDSETGNPQIQVVHELSRVLSSAARSPTDPSGDSDRPKVGATCSDESRFNGFGAGWVSERCNDGVSRDVTDRTGVPTHREMRQKNKSGNDSGKEDGDDKAGGKHQMANGGGSVITSNAGSAPNSADCNGHTHHSTARSILKSVLKRTGSNKKSGKGQNNPSNAPTTSPSNTTTPSTPTTNTAPTSTANTAPTKKKNRVKFDESLNKFFDADYVILIKEEDDYDGECDSEEMCTCSMGGDREMVRIDPGGRGFDLNFPETCTFEPPIEFIDQVTLSPPEGYKDVANNQNYYQYYPLPQQQPKQRVNVGTATSFDDNPPDESGELLPEITAQIIQFKCRDNPDESESSLERGSEEEDVTSPEQQEGEGGPLSSGEEPTVTEICVDPESSPRQLQDSGVEGGKSPQQRYIVETITMTTVTERRIVREADEHVPRRDISSGNNSKIITSECDNNRLSGILKGGKLWKSSDVNTPGPDSMFKSTPPMIEETSTSFSSSTPLKDSENTDLTGRRSVRFSEIASGNQDINDSCQDSDTNQSVKYDPGYDHNTPDTTAPAGEEASSPDSTELTLTFKLGNHVLVANSLRPNSAVRQLFPAQRFLSPPPLTHGSSYEDSGGEEDALNQSKARVIEDLQEVQSQWTDKINSDPSQQYIVTAESLRMFEEAKRSKFAQFKNNKDNANFQDNQSYTAVIPTLPLVSSTTNGNSDNDESPKNQIRRTIERNALRRSLLRYSNEPGSNRKHAAAVRKNSEDSLVERIRKLTCDLDEEEDAKKQKSNGKEPSKPGIDVATETAGDDLEIDFGINSTIPPRSSPPGEESRKPRETQSNKFITSPSSDYGVRFIEKTSSPSASTSSSNSSGSTSSTYKKLTDLFAWRNNENKTTDSNNSTQRNDCEINHLSYPPPASESQNWDTNSYQQTEYSQFNPPDLGNGSPNNVTPPKDFAENMLTSSAPDIHEKNIISGNFVGPKCAVLKVSSTAEARKQFLSTLAPLTACVSAVHSEDSDGLNDDHYKQVPVTSPLSVSVPGDRTSVASTNTAGEETEYSLDDIDEVLQDDQKAPQPDVVAGTQPQGSNTQVCDDTNGPIDELALFVQQDAGRTERIKKRYSLNSSSTASEDDEHDDYGFNRRPSVRGIKPRFCSTSEILQQIQAQHQPPALVTRVGSHMTWPYNSPETDDPALAHAPIGRRRGILHVKNTGTMPVLQEENTYTYSPTEQNRMNIGIPYSGDYHPGAVVHQPSPTDSVRKDGVTRRYVTPNQIMYASTGNLYQHPQQIMRIGGGCSDLQMYGSLGNRPHHHVQHLQYPAASNSPPPPGVYCNYPLQFQQGSQEQILPLPVTDPGNAPGFHQHYLEDQRFSSVQSLDRNTSSMYGRRGNQGLVQMRVSPVSAGFTPHYTGQVGPAAANIRFATPFNDPNVTAIIEPHYSTLQYAKPCPNNSSNATSIIRVGQGQQQTIRVPYPSGTPVKVHLLTRTGVGCPRSESPQRGPGSPVGHQSSSTLPSGQYASPPQQYAIARGTQTSSTPTTSSTFYQVPPNARYYPQTPPMTNNIGPMYNHIPPQQMHNNTRVSMVNAEHAVRPIHSPPPMNYCKPHVQQQTGRTTSPLPYQNISSSSSSTASSSPTRNKYSNERGVPEGAASSSPSFPQDSLYHLPLSTSNALSPVDSNTQTLAQSPISAPNTSATSGTTSVYYAMNV